MSTFRTRPLLVVGLLCLAGSLLAQEQEAVSPWTVGLELSTSLHFESDRNVPRYLSYTHQVVSGKVGYRPLRWLEPWARYQYHDITAQPPTVWAQENGDVPGGIVARYYEMDIHSLLLGASALFRVGQGDLGLSVGTGLSRRTGRLRAMDAEGQVTSASFSPLFEQNGFLQLDYTYWPARHFGIRVGISRFALIQWGVNSSFAPFRPATPVNLDDFTNDSTGAFRNENLRNNLGPGLNDYTGTWQLGLGIDYRF